MLRQEVLKRWEKVKGSYHDLKAVALDLLTKQTRLEEYLTIYQSSQILEVKCQDKAKTWDFLKEHYAGCKELNKGKFSAYFLTINFTQEITGTFDLSGKEFPNFLYLCLKGKIQNLKLICRVHDADGNPGLGFKRIEDNMKWIGLNQIPTLWITKNQKYQQENFQLFSEIKLLGKAKTEEDRYRHG